MFLFDGVIPLPCCRDTYTSNALRKSTDTSKSPSPLSNFLSPLQKHNHFASSTSFKLLNMFYSETLLSKTGPLARVWLSANIERKLSKSHILQSNIESSVSAIVDQGQAPMALRLSGQLLLGVVRIYSRKARYLLDDCNEALLKLKMV